MVLFFATSFSKMPPISVSPNIGLLLTMHTRTFVEYSFIYFKIYYYYCLTPYNLYYLHTIMSLEYILHFYNNYK